MSIPKYPKFKQLELCDRKALVEWFNQYPQTICEMNFVNLYIWRHFDQYKLTILNNNLCIHCTPPNETAYCFAPIGNNKMNETIKICLESSPRLSRVPDSFIDKHIKNIPGYKIDCNRNHFDYVYLTEELNELKGKKYDGKRNHIKKFKKKYPFSYRKLAKNDRIECLQVLKSWEAKRKHLSNLAIKSQEDAIDQIFDKYNELKVFGGALIINGKIEAFSLASELNTETADIHIEIANHSFLGIFQTINNEFVTNDLSKYKYVNREQDLGLAGMRKAKSSYHPYRMEKKFDIINT